MNLAQLAALEHRPQTRLLRVLEQADHESVRATTSHRLAEILLWCRERVPYFKQTLAGSSERAVRSNPIATLRDLPLLEKRDLHDHFNELVATRSRARGIRRNATGGSTGESAQFLQDAAYRRWNRAVLACFERWAGFQPGGHKVQLWGIPRDVERADTSVHRIKDRLLRRRTLNAYNLSEGRMGEYADRLRAQPPDLFRVFTQSGIEFARFLERSGRTLPLRSVTCSGALLLPDDRERMQQVFECPVRDSYGSREVGPMAAEFQPAGGLLVCPATHFIEILRPDGSSAAPGEEGEIVVTLLINRIMPLIRYRIGDRGVWAEEGAKQNQPEWPRIERLVGRTMSHVIAEDGTLRNSQLMSELVMFIDWIRRYQWVQDARDRIQLRIEPYPGHPSAEERARLERELSEEIKRIIGPGCRFALSVQDRIAPSPSGKHHYVVCALH